MPILMGFELVTDLAMDFVVGEMVAAPGDDWVAAFPVIPGLADVELGAIVAFRHYDVNAETASQCFGFDCEYMRHLDR